MGGRGLWVFFLVSALLGLACLPLLQFDFSPQTLSDSTSEAAKVHAAWRDRFGADDHGVLVLAECPLQRADCWQLLADIEDVLTERPEIEGLVSPRLIPVPRFGGLWGPLSDGLPASDGAAAALAVQASNHPSLRRLLVSEDGGVIAVSARLSDDLDAMDEVRPVIEGLESALAALTVPSVEGKPAPVHLLGPPAVRVRVVSLLILEQLKFVPLTGSVLLLVLFVLYRSVSGVLIPLISVGLGALATIALMAVTGQQINIINTIITTLILVIGVADAIHMTDRYAAERRRGVGRADAVRTALRTVGAACLLTSVTTAIGFVTLQTGQLQILRDFGLYAAAGVMLTFGLTILFVPWALFHSPQEPTLATPPDGRLQRWLASLTEMVIGRPRRTLLLSLAVVLALAAGIPGARVDNFIFEYLPQRDPSLAAHRVLEQELSGIVSIDVGLERPDGSWLEPDAFAAAQAAQAAMLARTEVHAILSPLTVLTQVRRATSSGGPATAAELRQLAVLAAIGDPGGVAQTHIVDDGRLLRLSLRTGDVGAQAYQRLEASLREDLAGTLPAGVEVTLTGTSKVGYAGIDSLVRDMLRSVGWAFALIFVVLALLFRSGALASIAMIPNVLPLIVVLGLLGHAGRHLETLSAMVFSIGLGIAVDDTIHYLARYCEEVRSGHSPEDAIRATSGGTGRAIVMTSLVLILGFGVLLSSRFPPNQLLAGLASLVIGAALLADLIVLPALLLVLRPTVPAAR